MNKEQDDFDRIIIHIDMDAYYAQCEMQKFNIPEEMPLAVLQWESLIALNYAAKKKGVKRHMNYQAALSICPKLIIVHIQTLTIKDGQEMIVDSAICKYVKVLKTNESIVRDISEILPEDEHRYRIKLETRDPEQHKASLQYYKRKSRKIFEIINKYSNTVEKYGSDEAYLNITSTVNQIFQDATTNFTEKHGTADYWEGSFFMPYKKDENGIAQNSFIPVSDHDKKLFIASKIAKKMRKEIFDQLGFKASAGISYNKLGAKLASS